MRMKPQIEIVVPSESLETRTAAVSKTSRSSELESAKLEIFRVMLRAGHFCGWSSTQPRSEVTGF